MNHTRDRSEFGRWRIGYGELQIQELTDEEEIIDEAVADDGDEISEPKSREVAKDKKSNLEFVNKRRPQGPWTFSMNVCRNSTFVTKISKQKDLNW